MPSALPNEKKRPDTRSGRLFACERINDLSFGLRLLEAKAAATFLPLPALLEEVNALKALQNVTLGRNLTGTLKRCMLAHFLLLPFNGCVLYHFAAGFSTGSDSTAFGSSVWGRKRL